MGRGGLLFSTIAVGRESVGGWGVHSLFQERKSLSSKWKRLNLKFKANSRCVLEKEGYLVRESPPPEMRRLASPGGPPFIFMSGRGSPPLGCCVMLQVQTCQVSSALGTVRATLPHHVGL